MTFIRYKKFGGLEYAYEITAYWDSKTKKPKQRSRYLGIVKDKENGIYEKKWQTKMESQILDFGDSYVLDMFVKNNGFSDLLISIFGKFRDVILALIYYRLCYGGAMMYAEKWIYGNFAKRIFPELNVSSQRISEYFEELGVDIVQRRFFDEYMKQFSHSKRGVVIDGTSLPNQIHNPLTAWGRSGEEIDKQIRFLLAIDRDTNLPLFFRLLPGNIIDVSSLRNTLYELKIYGIKDAYVFLDAGFYSDENLKDMYTNNVDFVIRLPSGRILYKELITNKTNDLESRKNFVQYGKRGLFVKEVEINLFDRKAFVYIVQDPMRRGREMGRYILDSVDDNIIADDDNYDIINKGIMIVVSSFKVSKDEIVPCYYTRQMAEVFFGFSKDDLGILPLRVHSEERIGGYLFLQFLSLIIFTQLKNCLGRKYTVEEVLLSMRNLKCKVYDNEIIVSEVTKDQREMAEKLGIIMPKTAGI